MGCCRSQLGASGDGGDASRPAVASASVREWSGVAWAVEIWLDAPHRPAHRQESPAPGTSIDIGLALAT